MNGRRLAEAALFVVLWLLLMLVSYAGAEFSSPEPPSAVSSEYEF